MINFIGLDAHSKTCTFAIVDKNGTLTDRRTIDTSEKNILSVIHSITGKKKLTFEESSLSQWLYLLLVNEVDELIVCNPLYLGRRQGNKNDFSDALHLSNELRCNHLSPVFHVDNYLIELRTLISGYRDVSRENARFKNQYKALFRSQALQATGKKIFKENERINDLATLSDKFVADCLFEQITTFEKIKSKYMSEFGKNKKKYPVIKNLMSIPGISEVRSHTIAALICSPDRFINKHKLWSYSMLVRHIETSDGVVYGKKIHYGRKELKEVFMGAATSVVQHGGNGLRKYYDRLRSKGIDDKKAKKALARKIAAISLTIMKKGIKYDDKIADKKTKH